MNGRLFDAAGAVLSWLVRHPTVGLAGLAVVLGVSGGLLGLGIAATVHDHRRRGGDR